MRLLATAAAIIGLIATAAAAAPATSGRTKTGIAYDVQGSGPVVVLITG